MVAHQQSLRDRQVGRPPLLEAFQVIRLINISTLASLEKILNLNRSPLEPTTTNPELSAANGLIPQTSPILTSDGDPIWKVLVFDNLGRDVISSVLRVNDLRGWGVTIHL